MPIKWWAKKRRGLPPSFDDFAPDLDIISANLKLCHYDLTSWVRALDDYRLWTLGDNSHAKFVALNLPACVGKNISRCYLVRNMPRLSMLQCQHEPRN